MNKKWKSKLIAAGKEKFGKWFDIETKELSEFYSTLFEYFTATCEKEVWRKGLLICGIPGSGKSIALELFNSIFKNLLIVDCREIIYDAVNIANATANHSTGTAPTYTIAKWGNKNTVGSFGREVVCLDNLGHESTPVVFYGTKYNIMSDIIVKRYELYRKYRYKTIFISNLDVQGIEDIYGDFIRDRLKEMCNYIHNRGESLRK